MTNDIDFMSEGGFLIQPHTRQLFLKVLRSCNVFMALVPKLSLESGEFCDYDTSQGRCWCRAELWCAQFSQHKNFPMIVVHECRVHDGSAMD